MKKEFPLKHILGLLESSQKEFVKVFEYGRLTVELYKPDGKDKQQPHKMDEVYIIVSGSGLFYNGIDKVPFERGDLLFVPAGREHRFTEFSEDFITWVLFFE